MYSDSAFSLIVPLCVIVLVFFTRKIILSLFIGIVIAGILMGLRNSLDTHLVFYVLNYVYENLVGVFYNKDSIKLSNIYVFGFLFLLCVITEIMAYSGGINAFVQWARKYIDTAKKTEFLTFIAGIIIFIDGYFNALIVGQATKPLSDANNSSREKLAYIIDSTSAPMCALVPISSLGAYMLGILATLGKEQGFLTIVSSIWGNYYAWFAIFVVFLTILWQVNFSAMKRHVNVGINSLNQDNKASDGSISLLLVPIAALIFLITFLIFYSGYMVSGSVNIFVMLSNSDGGFALFWGGFFTLIISLVMSFRYLKANFFLPIIYRSLKSIIPITIILVLAWCIGGVIKNDLQTGVYLANLSKTLLDANSLNAHIAIPIIIFALSSIIAFCTGTSWGTLAIMLPISLNVADMNGVDFAFVMSAVLSGAVYGDHASPISDTTILSATGASCSVQSHFITQLPYANIAMLVSFVSFGIAGYLDSIIIGHIIGILCIILTFWFFRGNTIAYNP